jgi:hypothetical protein
LNRILQHANPARRCPQERGDRELFQKMFASASRREFDCLLFWRLDSLIR